MAKAKPEAKDAKPDPGSEAGSFADRVIEFITSGYGDEVAQSGEAVRDRPQVMVPVSPALDAILGGGILEGSWVGITGAPKTGKTSTALCIARNAQKAEHGSRPVFYAKIEGRLSPALLKGTRGLDLSRGRFTVVTSQEGRLLSAQDYLNIISKIIEMAPGAVIIIDSISALCDDRELEGGVGTETRGATAKLINQFIRLNTQKVPTQRAIVIGITHQIFNTSGMGASKVERCPEGWKYIKDYDLKTVSKAPWKQGEKALGLEVKWACNTSKTGPPGGSIESYIRFNHGIDDVYEVLQFAVAFGLVRQAKAWYSFAFTGLESPPKFCGAEAACEAIRSSPEYLSILSSKVSSQLAHAELGGGDE